MKRVISEENIFMRDRPVLRYIPNSIIGSKRFLSRNRNEFTKRLRDLRRNILKGLTPRRLAFPVLRMIAQILFLVQRERNILEYKAGFQVPLKVLKEAWRSSSRRKLTEISPPLPRSSVQTSAYVVTPASNFYASYCLPIRVYPCYSVPRVTVKPLKSLGTRIA